MSTIQISLILILTCLLCVCSKEQEAEKRIDDFLKPPPLDFSNVPSLPPSLPTPTLEEQSYFSRFSNWLFPVVQDSAPRPSAPLSTHIPLVHHSGPAKTTDCTPCDQIPWVPIVGKHGSDAVIQFVPPTPSQNYHLPKNPVGYPFAPTLLSTNVVVTHFPSTITNLRPPPTYEAPRVKYPRKYGPPVQNLPSAHMSPPPFIPNFPNGLNLEFKPPPPQLTDSYGHPIAESVRVIHQQYLPTPSTYLHPIPFPNLSPSYVLPIHNAQQFNVPFRQTIPGSVATQHTHVQVIPSVPVASFLSTVEYPPKVVQSPIVDVIVKENKEPEENYHVNLSENPIIVDEHHQEASNTHEFIAKQNDTNLRLNSFGSGQEKTKLKHSEVIKNDTVVEIEIQPSIQTHLDLNSTLMKLLNIIPANSPKPFGFSQNHLQEVTRHVNHNAEATNNALFTPPSIDHTKWTPSSSINPPLRQSSWISAQNFTPFTTKKPKQIQIIIPYTTNNKNELQGRKVPSNLPYNLPLSLFTKLPTGAQFQSVTNIQDFFRDMKINTENTRHLPFDILKFQKNIDVWTEQEYNKMKTSRYAYAKKIPNEYLTTNKKFFQDHTASGSNQYVVNATEVESNQIQTGQGTTIKPKTEVNSTKLIWDQVQVTISPITNERVYVVTPQNWRQNETEKDSKKFTFSSPRFTVRPEIKRQQQTNTSDNKSSKETDSSSYKIHKVYSDWPELINGLVNQQQQTTTTTFHPLLGRMDISQYAKRESTTRSSKP